MFNRIWIPQAIAIAMLGWALNPANPYAYYILLRWVCCAIFLFLTIQAVSRNYGVWAWVLGFMAVIYNPLVRVHLNREIWSMINIITIILTLVSIYGLKSKEATTAAQKDRVL